MKSIKSNSCIPVLDKQAMTREIESINESKEIVKGGYKIIESYKILYRNNISATYITYDRLNYMENNF